MFQRAFRLFIIFFRVGAFTFGGGYAMVPVIQKEIVERAELISEEDFLDIIAVAQSLPGAIAVNTSVFVGFKLYRLKGAAFALLGTVLPSMIVILIMAAFYEQVKDLEIIQLFFQGVRPAIVALIFLAAVKLSKSLTPSIYNIIVGTIAFGGIVFFSFHPILMIILAAMSGLIFEQRRSGDGTA